MSESPFPQADFAAMRWAERVRAQRDELGQAALQEAAWARRLMLTNEWDPHYAEVRAGFRAAADRHLELLTGRPLVRAKP